MIKFSNAFYTITLLFLLIFSCSNNNLVDQEVQTNIIEEQEQEQEQEEETTNNTIKLLSLGDSYTIGQSVCNTCSFPIQLRDSLTSNINDRVFETDIIAQTGWTTTNLINAINNENPEFNYDLVTLLIGVNNQYQNLPFSIYQQEFPNLVNTAISLANNNPSNVIVISIPDYAFTPFGNGESYISEELDEYNEFAENYCNENNITYVYITDITRMGLSNPALVAIDNLHPSTLAYSLFVERLLPFAIEKIL